MFLYSTFLFSFIFLILEFLSYFNYNFPISSFIKRIEGDVVSCLYEIVSKIRHHLIMGSSSTPCWSVDRVHKIINYEMTIGKGFDEREETAVISIVEQSLSSSSCVLTRCNDVLSWLDAAVVQVSNPVWNSRH